MWQTLANAVTGTYCVRIPVLKGTRAQVPLLLFHTPWSKNHIRKHILYKFACGGPSDYHSYSCGLSGNAPDAWAQKSQGWEEHGLSGGTISLTSKLAVPPSRGSQMFPYKAGPYLYSLGLTLCPIGITRLSPIHSSTRLYCAET